MDIFKLNQNGQFLFVFNGVLHVIMRLNRVLVLINHNNLFNDDVFIGARAGQPVTHTRSANSKPQPSNQIHTGSKKKTLSQL